MSARRPPATRRPEPAARVVVVGSVNQDYLCSTPRLPAPGETVLGGTVVVASGGKGGNQAVAAARFGVATNLVSCVGDDAAGAAVCDALAGSGVDVSAVSIRPGLRTGLAFVFVTANGENAIVVAPGANSQLTIETTERALRERMSPGTVLVTQAEIPEAVMATSVATADDMGCRAILNLAPFRPLDDDVLRRCNPLVLNAGEAGALLGRAVASAEDARAACSDLRRRARSVVVTVGGAGAALADVAGVQHVAAPVVDVIDSTGAGDAFTGVLAASLARGHDLATAVRLGVAAGSYAVGRLGAQSSYPTQAQLATLARIPDVP